MELLGAITRPVSLRGIEISVGASIGIASWPADGREAIRRDELVLHWQPLVDVEDLSVIGLDALVRWNHPRHGLRLPSVFLPFARQTGLISAVDEWAAGAVARRRHAWHAQRLDPPLASTSTLSTAGARVPWSRFWSGGTRVPWT